MKTRIFGCNKFRRLCNEKLDRPLTETEELYVERHREVCRECAEFDFGGAQGLNILRSYQLDVELTPHFEDRVIRRIRIIRTKDGFKYWRPAIVGASIACTVFFFGLQAIVQSTQPTRFSHPVGEARRSPSEREVISVLMLNPEVKKHLSGSQAQTHPLLIRRYDP